MPHDVRIVFTAKKNWVSKLIRWATQGKASHVFMEYYDEGWGGRLAVEAGALGVRIIPSSLARHSVVGEFKCLFPTEHAFKTVLPLIGQRYDIAGLVWFAWAIILWRMFRKKLKKPLNNTKGQFCSELITGFLQAADNFDREKDPELTNPSDLWVHCTRAVAMQEMAVVEETK